MLLLPLVFTLSFGTLYLLQSSCDSPPSPTYLYRSLFSQTPQHEIYIHHQNIQRGIDTLDLIIRIRVHYWIKEITIGFKFTGNNGEDRSIYCFCSALSIIIQFGSRGARLKEADPIGYWRLGEGHKDF